MQSEVIVSDCSLAIGLDVDGKGSYAVVRDCHSGVVVYRGRISHDIESWSTFLLRFPDCTFGAFYEAGCIGYGLSRQLQSLGISCRVVPASDVPKEANAAIVKTDARDAERLSYLAWIPPHSFVREPTVEEECDRQLIRTREQCLKIRQATKNRIRKFMLYHGIKCPDHIRGGWNRSFRHWLETVSLDHGSQRLSLDVLLSTLKEADSGIKRIEDALRALSKSERYRYNFKLLTGIPGVGLITAMAFLLEIFRPEAFRHARELASHIGFTPSEWSSGGRSRKGHITHWGSAHLRRILVEAAWSWVRFDEDAKRCFHRIHSGKSSKKAIVGMARRLGIAMWAMVKKGEPYNYHWAA